MCPRTSSSGRHGRSNYEKDEVVIIVDPYSTGCCVAQEFSKHGYPLVCVWTKGFAEEMKKHVPLSCEGLFYHAEVTQGDTLEETETLIRKAMMMTTTNGTDNNNNNKNNNNDNDFRVAACIAGGEAGVDYADALSEHLGVRTNGTDIPNRRDKKIQQELIQAKGLRSVRQAGGDKFEDVEDFLRTEEYPLVLKPVESAGSDGVKLCQNFDEAKAHFQLLMNSQMVNGGECPAVLCQEFLRGKEYVVDHVSRDGVHKMTMAWVYDKRPANGSAFVYFGCVPIESNSPEANLVIPYIQNVLDAIGVKNGPSHSEVMLTPTGPCLVEVNCRANGGDGSWRPLACALTGGYSQVEATYSAYVDEEEFNRLPDRSPSPFLASGQETNLVSYSRGTVKATPGFDVIRQLPSFLYLETGVKAGSKVDYTVDLLTTPGTAILMHKDPNVLNKDLQFVRYLEEINGLFMYESKSQNLKKPQADEVRLVNFAKSKDDDGGEEEQPRRGVFSSEGPTLLRHMSLDRPDIRGPLKKRMTTVDASKEVVVVVNPYSTGAWIVKEILNRMYRVIALHTQSFAQSELKMVTPLTCDGLHYHAVVTEASTGAADTVKALYKAAGKLRIVACIAGGETGVELADSLSERLDVRSNGTAIALRHDKKVQQELIKASGLRSARQACGEALEGELLKFLETEPYPIVVKPRDYIGLDLVKLCHNMEEAKDHFHRLKIQSTKEVMCQEYLRGHEYVVDHVSRDGVHKTVMIWKYDKRPLNGAANVYFGTVPVPSDSSDAKLLIPYVRAVLDALGVKNGPSHGTVVMTPGGPCLIKLNCRAHGGDGTWLPLARALTGGYSQVEATVDSYLDQKAFFSNAALPNVMPSPFKAAGQEVILVSYSRGIVKSTPGFEEIKQMQSYVYLETGVDIGSKVDYTVDLFTCLGSVILMHPDPNVLQQDISRIRQLEATNAMLEYYYGGDMDMTMGGGFGSGIMKSPSKNILTLFASSSGGRGGGGGGDL